MVSRFFYPTVAIHAGAFAIAFLALSSDSVSSLSGNKRAVQPAAKLNSSAKGSQKPTRKKVAKAVRRTPPNTVRLLSSEDSGKIKTSTVK